MRYVAVGLCVFAVACGATPTAPTSSSTSIGGTSVAADVTGGSAVTQAPSDSDLPFKGDVQATEWRQSIEVAILGNQGDPERRPERPARGGT